MTFTVDFAPAGYRIQVNKGLTVLEAAQQSGVLINSPCGGRGICGRCRLKVKEGQLSPPTEAEKKLIKKEDLNAGYRLACQVQVLDLIKVEVPPESLMGRQQFQLDGAEVAVVPEPTIKRFGLELKTTTLKHPFSVWEQLAQNLETNYGLACVRVDPELMRRTPALAKDGNVVVTIRGKEINNIFFSVSAPKPLGLAVDLGTTKIAGFLVDLETGMTLASEGIANPQIIYGHDIISRLAYALGGEEQYRRIAQAEEEGLNRLLQSLLKQAGASKQDVEEAVIVGNTAMHHLLLRLPVEQLAGAPYVPATTFPIEIKARELGIEKWLRARWFTWCPPLPVLWVEITWP